PATGSAGAPSTTSTPPSLLQDMGFSPGAFGVSGIFTAAALVFFAFIGFDIVATAAEETRKPQRDLPIGIIASLAICTTLFVVVSAAVIVLRRTRPDLPRAFRCPAVPVVPILSVLASIYLMLNLPGETWLRFVVWMAVGLVVYFGYGMRRSRLAGARPAGHD